MTIRAAKIEVLIHTVTPATMRFVTDRILNFSPFNICLWYVAFEGKSRFDWIFCFYLPE